MPTSRLYKDSYKLGYNTRDNPEDIPFEACQSLVNLFPGDPSPRPRFGTAEWNTNALPGAVKRAFPWVDSIAPKVILHIGDGLYWQVAGSGALNTIDASIVPAGSKLSGIRIKDMLLVNNDLTGSDHRAWWISWTGSTFAIRNANIVRPVLELTVGPHDTGGIESGKIVSLAFTLVNRNDAASMDENGDPKLCTVRDGNFHPGLLESVDNLDNRTWYTQLGPTQGVEWIVSIDGGVDALDPQVTHIRYYRTEAAVDETVAKGLQHRWHADIPIRGANAYEHPWTFEDEFLAEETAGSLDVVKTVGYEPIPPGKYLLFHNQRLWVGGVGSSEEIGRNYYSEAPQDVEYPQKWWTMFQSALLFKDTSYEDAEPCMALAVSGNDIIFFMAVSLWYLRDGDPDFEPARISRTKGTAFPNSITQRDREVLYLSNEGPAVVAGREVDALNGHTAGEVWPKVFDDSQGYFFTLADKTQVYGFYYQQTWWLTDGGKLIGMFLPAFAKAIGPLSVEFADNAIGFGIPCVLDAESLCLLVSRTETGYIWQFLKNGVHNDNGRNFMLKGKSKAMYVSQKDRDRIGEAYGIKWFARYEDSAPLFLEIICDFFRFQMEFAYDEYTSEHILVSPNARASFRNIMEQGFPEGLVFSLCEIPWRKEHRAPYRFNHSGFILEYFPRDGYASEFVSRSRGEGLVLPVEDTLFYAKFDEDSDTLVDHSLFGRHHAWHDGDGGSRTHEPGMVPGGGQSVGGGADSGYIFEDWTALEHVGDYDGYNSSPLTLELVATFPDLSTQQVIFEVPGAEANSWIRWQVLADGGIEFQIFTSELSFRFTVAAGVLEEDVEYTIQFVLSNGGQNGMYYIGPRTGALADVLTMRESL